jgi:hypothetical protein
MFLKDFAKSIQQLTVSDMYESAKIILDYLQRDACVLQTCSTASLLYPRDVKFKGGGQGTKKSVSSMVQRVKMWGTSRRKFK